MKIKDYFANKNFYDLQNLIKDLIALIQKLKDNKSFTSLVDKNYIGDYKIEVDFISIIQKFLYGKDTNLNLFIDDYATSKNETNT